MGMYYYYNQKQLNSSYIENQNRDVSARKREFVSLPLVST